MPRLRPGTRRATHAPASGRRLTGPTAAVWSIQSCRIASGPMAWTIRWRRASIDWRCDSSNCCQPWSGLTRHSLADDRTRSRPFSSGSFPHPLATWSGSFPQPAVACEVCSAAAIRFAARRGCSRNRDNFGKGSRIPTRRCTGWRSPGTGKAKRSRSPPVWRSSPASKRRLQSPCPRSPADRS